MLGGRQTQEKQEATMHAATHLLMIRMARSISTVKQHSLLTMQGGVVRARTFLNIQGAVVL